MMNNSAHSVNSVLDALREHRIMAIARGLAPKGADEAAEALCQGGIRLIEVTLNTPGAPEIIARWRSRFEGRMRVGAGTVLDESLARQAIQAGAEFLVSPNVDEAVIRCGARSQVEVFSGALSPTEIVRAWKAGASAIKVFPASAFGPQYLRELRGPLEHIPLIAVGGVHADNLEDFLRAGAVGVGLGSSLVNLPLIQEGRFDELQVLAQRCVRAAQGQARGEARGELP